MNCTEYRKRLEAADDSPELLAHQRECAECLELAIAQEPSSLFSTMGGDEMLPPGGLDAFVSGVMNEVRLRETERSLETEENPVRIAWWWAAAAAVFVTFTSWIAIQPRFSPEPAPVHQTAIVAEAAPVAEAELAPTMTRPVVTEYARAEATIVELPSESVDDLKIVMIFDDSLPQDL